MKYRNETDFKHDEPEALGVLLVNLGTPDAPEVPAVRRYLAEFLSDPRVIELPRLLWLLILNLVLLRVRPPRTAAAYQEVWSAHGSPLLSMSRRQVAAFQPMLDRAFAGPVKVQLAMRYGHPSIPDGLEALNHLNARRVLVLPLYPQYSAPTTASVFDAVTRELTKWRRIPEMRFVNQYHDEPTYIEAIAQSIRDHWATHGEPDRLLFSFHGIPQSYFMKGDPYFCQCQKTTRLVVEALQLPQERWAISFQSRVGTQEWLNPYTDELLTQWGEEGAGTVHVVCPGFSVDCLETLEEVAIRYKEVYLGAGGKGYDYIPALNDSARHIEMMVELVRRHAAGWPQVSQSADESWTPDRLGERLERARALGAEC